VRPTTTTTTARAKCRRSRGSLLRRRGRPPFSPQETELVASLSAPLGEALRVRARPAGLLGGPAPYGRPGLLLFDPWRPR
jgi:hypothetical protein